MHIPALDAALGVPLAARVKSAAAANASHPSRESCKTDGKAVADSCLSSPMLQAPRFAEHSLQHLNARCMSRSPATKEQETAQDCDN